MSDPVHVGALRERMAEILDARSKAREKAEDGLRHEFKYGAQIRSVLVMPADAFRAGATCDAADCEGGLRPIWHNGTIGMVRCPCAAGDAWVDEKGLPIAISLVEIGFTAPPAPAPPNYTEPATLFQSSGESGALSPAEINDLMVMAESDREAQSA